jgi:FkbM family methyltransferase
MNFNKFISTESLQYQEKILLKFCNGNNLIIFDIGACEGESSIRYSRLFPKSIIYTFEPLPNNYDIVLKNILDYKCQNIIPQNICLSNKIGKTIFYVSSGKPENTDNSDWNYGNKSSSLLKPEKTKEVHKWLEFNEEIELQTITLKQFCSENEINTIDFIHMDVQGAELLVLEGAKDLINNINLIWLEVEAVELYKGQPLKNDVEKFMLQNNFIKIADTVYNEAGDQFWVNYKYIIENNLTIKIYYLKFINKIYYLYKKIKTKIL